MSKPTFQIIEDQELIDRVIQKMSRMTNCIYPDAFNIGQTDVIETILDYSIVSGGTLLACISDEFSEYEMNITKSNDIDVYVNSIQNIDIIIDYLQTFGELVFINTNERKYVDDDNPIDKDIDCIVNVGFKDGSHNKYFQLINFEYNGDPTDVLDTFDMDYVQSALFKKDNKIKLCISDWCIDALRDRKVTYISKIKMHRIIKANLKGFKCLDAQNYKLNECATSRMEIIVPKLLTIPKTLYYCIDHYDGEFNGLATDCITVLKNTMTSEIIGYQCKFKYAMFPISNDMNFYKEIILKLTIQPLYNDYGRIIFNVHIVDKSEYMFLEHVDLVLWYDVIHKNIIDPQKPNDPFTGIFACELSFRYINGNLNLALLIRHQCPNATLTKLSNQLYLDINHISPLVDVPITYKGVVNRRLPTKRNIFNLYNPEINEFKHLLLNWGHCMKKSARSISTE